METHPEKPTSHRTRPEARPYRWNELTGAQQEVAQDIHGFLTAFVNLPLEEAPRRGPFTWRIDHYRSSNVILIDGGRGSGKTTVMLTLLDLWLRELRGESTADVPESILGLLRKGPLDGMLIPLRTLDLQPLPQDTSLLTWLAGRLLEFVDDLEGGEARERGAPPAPIGSWNPKWEAELPSRRAWRELLQDAATGLDGNLAQRKRELDPESYAVELGHAERARLSVQDRWREFVTRVAEDAHQRLHRVKPGVRFLLPIDDADMNPHRCVELLDLLRSFWHPRLVFLLTGDTELFIKTLQLHHQGQFQELLGETGRDSRESARLLDSNPEAQDLAWSTYDKVIPRNQRFALPPLPLQERLHLMKDLLDTGIQRVDEALPPSKLAEYFEFDPFLQQGFPRYLRQLQDLRQRLGGLPSGGRAGPLVYQMWQSALSRGNFAPAIKDALLQVVQLRGGGLHVDVRSPLTWKGNQVGQYHFKASNTALSIAVGTGFEYTPAEQQQPLPNDILALLLLALDIAWDEKDGSLATWPLSSGWENPLVGGSYMLEGNRSVVFPWPLPDWAAPSDYHFLMRAWVHPELHKSGVLSNKAAGVLARRYLGLVHSIGLERATREPLLNEGDDAWQPTLGRLLESLDVLVKQRQAGSLSLRQEAFERWLWEGAMLLATPESGLPAETANELLSTWFSLLDRKRHPRMKKRLKQGRRDRAEAVLSNIELQPHETVEFVLSELDQLCPEFEWAYLIEGRSPPVVEMSPELRHALQRIPVHHPRKSSAQVPETLASYIEVLGIQPHISTRSQKRMDDLADTMQLLVSSRANASSAIEELWGFVVSNESKATRRKAQSWLARSGVEMGSSLSLQLRTEPTNKLPPDLRQRITEPTSLRTDFRNIFPLEQGGTSLILHKVQEPQAGSLAAVYGLLQLAHDVALDETDASQKEPSPLEEELTPEEAWVVPSPYISTGVLYRGTEVQIDWPVPAWNTFLDWTLMEELWEAAKSSSQRTNTPNEDSEPHQSLLALHILRLLVGLGGIIRQRRFRDTLFLVEHRDRNTRWTTAASVFTFINLRQDVAGKRWLAIRQWAEVAGYIFATPEMGMPVQDAAAFLRNVSSFLTQDDHSAIQVRRMWARRSLRLAGLEHDEESISQFLKEMDDKNPQHPWHEYFGAKPSDDVGGDDDNSGTDPE